MGSDVDLLILVTEAPLDYFERYRRFEPPRLPVPADVLVYTQAEWKSLAEESPNLWNHMNECKIDLVPELPNVRGND